MAARRRRRRITCADDRSPIISRRGHEEASTPQEKW